MGAPSMYETHSSSAYSHNPPPPPLPLPGISDNWVDYFPETKSQYCDGCGSTHGAAHEFDESNSRYLIGTVMDQIVDDIIGSARPYLSSGLLRKMRDGAESSVEDAIKVLSGYSVDAVKAHASDAIYRETVARSSAFDRSSMPPSRLPEPTNQSAWGPQEDDWTGRNPSQSSYSKRPASRGRSAPPSFIPRGRI